MMGIQDDEEVYIGGDFNGDVGRLDVGYERMHGGWGFGTRNDDGEILLQTVTAFDLDVTNTWFQKINKHVITYKSDR